jgi:hypothetical protein
VTPPALTRRRALGLLGGAVAAAGVSSGCTTGSETPEPDPVLDALVAVWTGEWQLIRRYDATLARHPSLAARLTSVRDDHAAHARAIGSLITARQSPGATPSAVAVAGKGAVPATAAAALAGLATAETKAAAAATSACMLAAGDTAALLASVAACEASHVVVLR